MKLKIFLILLIFLSCEDFDYRGLKIQFVGYSSEKHFYSGLGWSYSWTFDYKILKGNDNYKKGQLIREQVFDFYIKPWMLKKKLWKKFYIVRDGVPISYILYFQ